MTMRLSMSSLAGTARTLVRSGPSSEASMLVDRAGAAPRSGADLDPRSATWRLDSRAGARRGAGAPRVAAAGSLPGLVGDGLAGASRASARWRRVAGLRGCRSRRRAARRAGAGVRRPGRRRAGAAARGAALGRRGRPAPAAGCAAGRTPRPAWRSRGRRRRCRWPRGRPPAGSPRRTPTTPGRRSSCRSGTARTARPRATRWARRPPWGRWSGTGRARRIRLFRSVDNDGQQVPSLAPPPVAARVRGRVRARRSCPSQPLRRRGRLPRRKPARIDADPAAVVS